MLRLFTLFLVAIALIYVTEGTSDPFSGLKMIGRKCKPLDCGGKFKNCQYGLRKVDGCETCKCHDPCNPPGQVQACGFNKKCSVERLSSGTFVARCNPIRPKRNNVVCKHKKAVGTCRGAFKRFYYSPITNRCEEFVYTGCGGNGNNFQTKRECQATC